MRDWLQLVRLCGDQIQESLKEFVHCRIGAIEQILLITEKIVKEFL